MPRASQKETVSSKLQTFRRHLTWHYYSKMPLRKRYRILVWIAFFSYSGIVAAQLLYPVDRALPRASIQGEVVAYKKHEEIAALLAKKFDATTLIISTEGKKASYPLKNAGAELASESMILQTETYPLLQRFIPFSIFWQPVAVEQTSLAYTNQISSSFSTLVSKELTAPAVNAGLTIENGALKATSDIPGVEVTADDVKAAITHTSIKLGEKNVIRPRATVKPAETTMADFEEVKTKATSSLNRSVVIVVDGERFEPDVKQRASWLTIGIGENKQPVLTFNQAAFYAYLDTIDKAKGTQPGVTHITYTDGVETGRNIGATGRLITREPLQQSVESWLLTGRGRAISTATFHDVAPSFSSNSVYSPTQAGLQAYLNDLARRMNVRVVIQQISGPGWVASVRADESTVAASTYKLYVAKWLFSRLEAGATHWEDAILDTNVSTCFDRMTIASTNPCAEEWIRQAGRTELNNFLYSQGFSGGTFFSASTAAQSTANDLRKFMVGLENGSLVGGAYRDRLIHSLSLQPYRYGIPTGSKGTVYDKVGLLWDYVHDAAIVYHPRGKYVMVIMTKGQSYATLAAITRQVEQIMYP